MELQLLPHFGYDTPEDQLPTLSTETKKFYSRRLVNLVGHCYEMNPNNRVAVDQLWREVRNAVTVPWGDKPEAVQDHVLPPEQVLRFKNDNRYMNFARG